MCSLTCDPWESNPVYYLFGGRENKTLTETTDSSVNKVFALPA